MFVRVVRGTNPQPSPDWDQEAARHTERTIGYLRQQPGFHRYIACRDAARTQGIAITEWDTREQAQQFAQRPDLAQEVSSLGIRVDAIEIFEVETIAEQVQVVA